LREVKFGLKFGLIDPSLAQILDFWLSGSWPHPLYTMVSVINWRPLSVTVDNTQWAVAKFYNT